MNIDNLAIISPRFTEILTDGHRIHSPVFILIRPYANNLATKNSCYFIIMLLYLFERVRIMSRKEKLILRLQQRPKDFTWVELRSLLKLFGYREAKTGRTGGSRRRFVHPSAVTITLHKPHPQNVLKRYAIDQVLDVLRQEDML